MFEVTIDEGQGDTSKIEMEPSLGRWRLLGMRNNVCVTESCAINYNDYS